ncbi:MAG: hypothetical protein AAF801_00600 [Pseudomonadota bacterium]
MVYRTTRAMRTLIFSISTLAAATAASASEMALTFEKQGVTIAGQYAGFQQNAYVLLTAAGMLYVPANLVTCEGDDCLEILTAANDEN